MLTGRNRSGERVRIQPPRGLDGIRPSPEVRNVVIDNVCQFGSWTISGPRPCSGRQGLERPKETGNGIVARRGDVIGLRSKVTVGGG